MDVSVRHLHLPLLRIIGMELALPVQNVAIKVALHLELVLEVILKPSCLYSKTRPVTSLKIPELKTSLTSRKPILETFKPSELSKKTNLEPY